jgi:DNA-binding transcriptional MerR regulator
MSEEAMTDTLTVSDSPAEGQGQTPTPLLSKKAAAAQLGVAEKTIERYVHEYALLTPAGEDPQTGAKLFDPDDIERLRLSPPTRRKSGPDSPRQSDLALRDLITAMQEAHAETIRAKDETIATLREQVDSLRQSQQILLAARTTDTDTQPEGEGQTPTVAPSAAPGTPEAPTPDNPSGVPSAGVWARVRRVFVGE